MTVKIFDLRMSNSRFCLRVLLALFWAGLVIFFYYYLPFHAGPLISKFVPPQYTAEVQSALASFVLTGLFKYLGIVFAVSAFIGTILKGSWGYGIYLISIGVFYAGYYYYLYETGSLFSGFSMLSNSVNAGVDLGYVIDVFTLLLVIFTIEDIVRGSIIVARRPRGTTRVVQQSLGSGTL